MANTRIDNLCINTIRMLAADAVEQANSGHPGLPMGAAAFTYGLWMHHLRFNPNNPEWVNRDRFVLSAGHGSMLLYSLLHLTGYDLSLNEIKHFRQWGSKTPGHPEHGLTPGVETTTGPLGQGFANGVGMALAERFLADRYNQKDFSIIDYYTYALVSDGDLMEGISSEAASYAGSLGLGKLIYLYDSNRISIEGSTDLTFREDVAQRFQAYGWQTIDVPDANELKSVDEALEAAKQDRRPSLIILHTHIGFGSPHKQDSAAAHGSALGQEELAATKKALSWPEAPSFYIPSETKNHMRTCKKRGSQLEATWNKQFEAYQIVYPELAREIKQGIVGSSIDQCLEKLSTFKAEATGIATREASGIIMNTIAADLPLFVGGSADLAPSNNTHLNDFPDVTPNNWQHGAKNLHFGIREHAMGGILNGLALSNQFLPFGGTFLCFSDYMRAPIRLASLMRLGVVYIFTHDSIGQGEDGATHQPIEQLASLRAMPGLYVIRPSDANETVEAWKQILIHRDVPTALVLSRQKLPIIDRTKLAGADNLRYGGYILKDCPGQPDVLLIATGSEVAITIQAAELLVNHGIQSRVISMPCTELFEIQPQRYQLHILPPSVKKRLVIEAASPFGWSKYSGEQGEVLGIEQFGASAPGSTMMEKYGFTAENVVKRVRKMLQQR